ncbi:MAG: S1C family serine protease [Flavobacteriaceae bacterium]
MKTILKYSSIALLSSVLSLTLMPFFHTQPSPDNTTALPSLLPTTYSYSANVASSAPSDFVEAAEKSIHAVVHVKNTASGNDDFSALDYLYGRRSSGERIGVGSGVIVSPDGFIITNNHVIEEASKIEITTNDNRRYTAKLVGTDAYTDIAVLKVDVDQSLPYLSFGNSNNTRIGEWVLAIGNPFNLNSTVTAGIISAKSRDLNERDGRNQSFIQTDAAVNRGNSGGALVNTRGELVGINTAISSMSGGFEGYSFAVPSNIARKVFEDIVEFGSTQKGLLGVRGGAITPEFKEQTEGVYENEGFYVGEVLEGMGAASAGIKVGDVLLKIDNVKLKKFSDLSGYLESKRPGDRVNVLISRDGKQKNIVVELKKNQTAQFLRMRLRNLNSKEQADYGTSRGVLVEEAGDFFSDQIKNGSLLVEINGERIFSIDDLNNIDRTSLRWLTYIDPSGEKIHLRL